MVTYRQDHLVVFDRVGMVAVTVNGVASVVVTGSSVLLLTVAIVSWWEVVSDCDDVRYARAVLRHRVIDCDAVPSNDSFSTSCLSSGYDVCDPSIGYDGVGLSNDRGPYCYLLRGPYRGYGDHPCVNTQRLGIAIHSCKMKVSDENYDKLTDQRTRTLIACGLHYLVSVRCYGLAAAMWWHYALPINSHKHRSDGCGKDQTDQCCRDAKQIVQEQKQIVRKD